MYSKIIELKNNRVKYSNMVELENKIFKWWWLYILEIAIKLKSKYEILNMIKKWL